MELPTEFPMLPDRLNFYTVSAGDQLRNAAEGLIEEWADDWAQCVESDNWEYFDDPLVHDLMLSRRADDAKAALLRLRALHVVAEAARFELALSIAVGLETGESWGTMAKMVGVSRQALHRRFSALVSDITATIEAGGAPADIAARIDEP